MQTVAVLIGAVEFRLRSLGMDWLNRKLGAHDAHDLACSRMPATHSCANRSRAR